VGEDKELPTYAIESVDNALRLLLMLQERESIRVSEASAELGIARSTAHRLLLTLAHRGFVQQERKSHIYHRGRSLLEFNFPKPDIFALRTAAHKPMVDLSAELNETVNLMVLENDRIRFVESIECDRPVRVTGRTGLVLPAHATAGGKALLAHQEPPLQLNNLRSMTSATITATRQLEEELSSVRRRGYALNLGESMDGLHAVAVPVFNRADHAVASLAASVPADRGGPKRLKTFAARLRLVADRIRSAM
jgi:DNA-binding IclR family transcriptional regulator